MLKIKDLFKKKKTLYDFNYKIYWKDGITTSGTITNSELPPEDIFLTNVFTYFNKGVCTYYNKSQIQMLEINDLVEKVEDK